MLRHHVGGIPVGPVCVALPGALLMLSVRRLCTPERARQIACGAEGSRGRINAPRQPGRDLLQQPAIAVRVAERGERAVRAAFRIRTTDWAVQSEVEDLAHLDAGGDQSVAGSLNVGDDQVSSLERSGRGRREIPAELDRAPGAERRELDHARAGRRDVLPPPEPGVELLRAVDIGDGDYDYLELHVNSRDVPLAGVVSTAFNVQVCHVLSFRAFN